MSTYAQYLAGKDYPKPIVNHDTARKQNLDRMSLAFAANKQLAQVRYGEGRWSEKVRILIYLLHAGWRR